MGNESSHIIGPVEFAAEEVSDEEEARRNALANSNEEGAVEDEDFGDPVADVGEIVRDVASLFLGVMGSAASSAASTASASASDRYLDLPESDQRHLQHLWSLILAGGSALSLARGSQFSRGVSPLLLASDIGISGLINSCGGLNGNRQPQGPEDVILRPRLTPECRQALAVKKTLNGVPSGSKAEEEFTCPICLDVFHQPMVTRCDHVFCLECILRHLAQRSICPICRRSNYASNLKALEHVNSHALRAMYERFQKLEISCPKCHWGGPMALWSQHVIEAGCSRARRSRRLSQIRKEMGGPPTTSDSTVGNIVRTLGNARPPPPPAVPTSSSSSSSSQSSEPNRVHSNRRSHRHLITRSRGRDGKHKRRRGEKGEIVERLTVSQPNASRVTSESSTSSTDQTRASARSSSSVPTPRVISISTPTHSTDGGPTSFLQDPPTSSSERLIEWLLENPLGDASRLFVISHRMENTTGAIGGLVLGKELSHVEVVVEFKAKVETDDDGLQPRTFLSLETMANVEGVQWVACTEFPVLRPSAQEIAIFNDVEFDGEGLLRFLLDVKDLRYNLLGWNCQHFARELRRRAKTSETPNKVQPVPRPMSYSADLMSCLSEIQVIGNVAVRPSWQSASPVLSSSASPGLSDGWIGYFNRFVHRFGTSSPKSVLVHTRSSAGTDGRRHRRGATPVVHVHSITVCLFPAEDRHRKSLRPAAQFVEFVNRTLHTFKRPPSLDAVASARGFDVVYGQTLSSDEASSAPERGTLDPSGSGESKERRTRPSSSQLRLRYETYPIMLLEMKADNPRGGIESVGYLSLEFRSDCGLWWHFYAERPPGLDNTGDAGGTDVVVSAQTLFPLDLLVEFLKTVENKEYNPMQWAGWDFAERLVLTCCPEQAPQLLEFPIAESVEFRRHMHE